MTNWDSLRRNLDGRLVLPADAGYEVAKQLQSAQFDQIRPRAVAYCASPADVSACLRFAARHDIAVTPRGGGHSIAGYSTSDGLVVDLSRLRGIEAGPRTVRIGAGAQTVDVTAILAAQDLQVNTGTCPTVGAAGFLLGGGHGPQTRRFGMACDRLVSADVVLADGTAVRASQHEHPDLFWALRGGGGNFGVVTEIEVLPIRAPRVVVYNLWWDWDDALYAMAAWQSWIMNATWDLSSRIWVARGGTARPQVLVHGTYLGEAAACQRQLDQLAAAVGKPPGTATVNEWPYLRAMMEIYGCGEFTVAQSHRVGSAPEARLPRDNHILSRNRFFTRPMPADALQAAISAFATDPLPGQFRIFGLFGYGGRVNELDSAATAYVHRDAELSAFYSASIGRPDSTQGERQTARSWVDRGFDTIDPYSNGRSYQNFMDPALKDWRESYYGQNYPKLRAIKREYDPQGLFRFAQGID